MNAFAVLFWVLLVSVALAARQYGGQPERRAAFLFVVAALLTIAIQRLEPQRYHRADFAVAAVDVALFAFLALLAVRNNRSWIIVATALQALPILAHLGKLVNPQFWRLGYAIMASASGIPTLVVLAIGIWTHHKRKTTQAASPGSSATPAQRQRRTELTD